MGKNDIELMAAVAGGVLLIYLLSQSGSSQQAENKDEVIPVDEPLLVSWLESDTGMLPV